MRSLLSTVLTLSFSLASLVACSSDDGGDGGAAGGTTGAGGGDGDGASWEANYTGALSGWASGGVVVVDEQTLSARRFIVACDTHASGDESALAFTTQDDPANSVTGAKSVILFNLTLSDGTECSVDTAPPPEEVTIVNGAEGSFEATFTDVSVDCDGQQILVSGFARE